MSEGQRRPGRPGRSEYRVQLPETVDTQQLLLALDVAPESSAAPTFAEFFPRFINQYAKANRQKPAGVGSKESHFRNHLKELFGLTPLDKITAEQVQELKQRLSIQSAKTVNNILSTLSKTLKVAVDWAVIPRMPVRIDPLPTQLPQVHFWEKEEYARLILGGMSAGPRELAVVLLGGDCGLRKGEMIALRWTDLDFARAQICIQRSETKGIETTPKGGRSRIVPMTPQLHEVLKLISRGMGQRVFYRRDGQPMTGHRICTMLARAERRCGFPDKGALHILRHTYCSHLAMAGVPARTIQELAGHVSLRTTERYMHLAPAEKSRALTQLELYRRP